MCKFDLKLIYVERTRFYRTISIRKASRIYNSLNIHTHLVGSSGHGKNVVCSRHLIIDANERFSIQSISKVFTLTMAFAMVGVDLGERFGKAPSTVAFEQRQH